MIRLTQLTICLGLLLSISTHSRAQKGFENDSFIVLRIVVTVPPETLRGDSIYLCGDSPYMGAWNGRGLKLDPQDDGTYQHKLIAVQGAEFQFKVTRGSWQTVEKNADGSEASNRLVVADKDKVVPVNVASWADSEAKRPEPTLTGDIRRHEGFHSEILGNDRTLLVYLPPGYDQQTGRRFPVLYMHDGQNLFDASTSFAGTEWRVDEAAQRLIKAGDIEPIIIVGMYNNSDRMTEYTPRPDGELGDAYARFVVEEVKPFIDRTYRSDPAREKTGIAGSSLGGLISLYMAREHAQTFGLCGGVSPSLGWRDRELLEAWRADDTGWMKQTRFWIDMGTEEGRPVPDGSVRSVVLNARALAELFDQAGLVRGEGYQYMEIKAGRHNETAWAERIEDVLIFLYGH